MNRLLRNLTAAFTLALAVPSLSACESVETGDEQNVTAGAGRFETYEGADGQFYFQLLAGNGERILQSEGYTTLANAKKGITSVKRNGVVKSRFKVLASDNGEYYFNLTAQNGEVIGTSELYATKSNATRGVTAVTNALETPATAAASAGDARFETFKSGSKTYFRLRAGNGQIVLQSQGYSSKSAAENGIDSVEANAVDASNFQIVAGQNGQHTFRLVAGNGEVIGRGEMYVSKSNAVRGAGRVREIVRALVGTSAPSDADIQSEIEKAADGLTYMSESDYPFTFVRAVGAPATITEAAVRNAFAKDVDGDEDADKPLAALFAMEETWQEWKDSAVNCSDPSDPEQLPACNQTRLLEQVLENNLEDVHVYYFGRDGAPGRVDGVGVSILIVGRSPDGNLVGVRTIAIWT